MGGMRNRNKERQRSEKSQNGQRGQDIASVSTFKCESVLFSVTFEKYTGVQS